ncbi:RGG repeats nuclear RNA binding protein A-like [Primulina huaijiensis]|uniref:RGG repeats nuclear RNA binding protein A-like n=1 Tax=Primulina huaijiensis TaxID=1492673 RepID=UPI003CC6EA6A
MKSWINGLSSQQIRNPNFASVSVGEGAMATLNPFDLLEDDDTEDPSLLIAAQQKKIEPKKPSAPHEKPAPPPAKLPSKPLPPSEAVREAKTESARGGGSSGRGRGYGRGRGAGSGFNRDSTNNSNSPGNKVISGAQGTTDEADNRGPSGRRGGYGGPRGPFRGGRRGGFSNGGEDEGERERPRRAFERHSGTGRGGEMKREGSGQGNWGTQIDEPVSVVEEAPNEGDKSLDAEKPSVEEDTAADGNKEAVANEVEEKEPEDKEMTLEEYEKVREEKRKGLQALKSEGRKVDAKEFEAMKPLANKKTSDDIFVKLGSEKDKRKESAEKEEKTKKSVSINEFLKPPEGQNYGGYGGRGRGRGRGPRGGYGGASDSSHSKALSIGDPDQFPTLGGK